MAILCLASRRAWYWNAVCRQICSSQQGETDDIWMFKEFCFTFTKIYWVTLCRVWYHHWWYPGDTTVVPQIIYKHGYASLSGLNTPTGNTSNHKSPCDARYCWLNASWSNSIANTLGLLQSCAKPSIWYKCFDDAMKFETQLRNNASEMMIKIKISEPQGRLKITLHPYFETWQDLTVKHFIVRWLEFLHRLVALDEVGLCCVDICSFIPGSFIVHFVLHGFYHIHSVCHSSWQLETPFYEINQLGSPLSPVHNPYFDSTITIKMIR